MRVDYLWGAQGRTEAMEHILGAWNTESFRAVSDFIRMHFKISLALVRTIFAFDKQIFLCASVEATHFLKNSYLHA